MIDRNELDARIEGFHGANLDQVLDEVDYLRDAGDTVIAGGSLAYGLGNLLSDLDIVITGPTTAESSRIPLEHFLGSLRVDVWKLSQKLIEDSFRRARQALDGLGPLLGNFGDADDEDGFKLLHRIAFGVVIDGPSLDLAAFDCRAVAAGVVMREYAERMRTSALVAQLALRANRPIAAVVNARLAVESALQVVVTQSDLPFSGDKWLGERVDAQAPGLASLYEPFRRLPATPDRDGKEFVESALQVCTGMWGYDLELARLAAEAWWDNVDAVRLAKVGADSFLVGTNSGTIWELDQSEYDAWFGLAMTEGEQEGGLWSLASCDPEQLTLCVSLFERGLLKLRWTKGVPLAALRGAGGEHA